MRITFYIVESVLTSNKRIYKLILFNKINTEILNPDWLKLWKCLSLKCLFVIPRDNKTTLPFSRYQSDLI